jgi:hypothetical protein
MFQNSGRAGPMPEWSITPVEQDPSRGAAQYYSGGGLGRIIGLWVMSGDVASIGGALLRTYYFRG